LKADGGKEVAKTADSNSGDSDVGKNKKRKFSEIDSSAPISNGNGNGTNGSAKKVKNEPFRRVKAEEIEIPHEGMRDISYKNFDTKDTKANQDLIVTKGKGFRSEKTKKKRGSYSGGSINVGVTPFRFDNDSD
jgi:hypothetical protein